MNWADYIILTIIGFSALVSVMRGFVREAVALGGWILALWVAVSYMNELAGYLTGQISVPSLRAGTAFFVLFAAVLMAVALINAAVGMLVEKSGLSATDRTLGILFGAARGVVIVALLVLAAGLTQLPRDPWWRQSLLIPRVEPLARQIQALLPPDIGRRFRFR